MLKALTHKTDSIQEQMGNVSRDEDPKKKNKRVIRCFKY